MLTEEKLFRHFQDKGMLDGLKNPLVEKFRYACEKAVLENPGLDFGNLVKVCGFYLNTLKEYPECNL